MMDQMETYLNRKLLKNYPPGGQVTDNVFPMWPFVPFLRHIRKHSSFYKIALQHRKNFPLSQGYEPLLDQIIRPRCAAAGITSESEMLYYFVYFQAGFTMVLKRWVDTGCLQSEEELAQILQNCIPAVLK